MLMAAAGGGSAIAIPYDLDDSAARVNVDTGAGYKSFPGMTLRSGRLHLVYRHGTDHFTTADGVVKYRHSDDFGATWSAAATIISDGTRDLRDPSIVCTSSGRLVVGYDSTDHVGATYSVIKVIYSDDGGSTWSSPYTITSSGLAYECAGTSQVVELDDGTLVLPAFGANTLPTIAGGGAGVYFKCVLFKSTDDGATWGSQTTIAAPSADRAEPQLRLLTDGTLVCLMHDVDTLTYRATSTDDGATWSSSTSVLTALGRNDFVEVRPTLLAMWCRDGAAVGRNRWTVSRDQGLTWETLRTVDSSGDVNEYAAPVVTDDHTVVVVYALENSSTDADLYCRTYTLEAA